MAFDNKDTFWQMEPLKIFDMPVTDNCEVAFHRAISHWIRNHRFWQEIA